MAVDGSAGGRWFDHLTASDRALLARVAWEAGVEPQDALRNERALTAALAHPATFRLLFAPPEEALSADSREEPLLPASPFLTFAVVVHRSWAELQGANHVEEWVGPRQRLPVLGGNDLRDFLESGKRRFFLAELLSSYTRVSSGSAWVQTTRGWRRRRYSELDPVRLASMLELVHESERPGVYRRLGDLALFLTGVFPDHTELHGLGPVDEARLLRLSGLPPEPDRDRRGAVDLLERLGERWYRLATRTMRGPLTGSMSVVAEMAERFGPARRTLNYLTDRHLFPRRAGWFGREAS